MVPKPGKPMQRLTHHLTRGNLWLYLLSLLRKKKRLHAYTLDDAIERSFSFRPNKVMVYIVLYKLEREGLIGSVYDKRRRYYRITPHGKKALEHARRYFQRMAKKI